MENNFSTLTVNGIEIEVWAKGDQSGRTEARRLAGRLPRGGEINQDTIRKIDAPVSAGGTIEVWMEGEGFSEFKVPDGYEVKSVFGFEDPGICIGLQKSE